jgi:hypothetical protein
MIPAPPPPVGAPENVLGAWAHLSQKWTREGQARNRLAALIAANSSHGTIVSAQKELAFAEQETKNVREEYRQERIMAGYPEEEEDDDERLTA